MNNDFELLSKANSIFKDYDEDKETKSLKIHTLQNVSNFRAEVLDRL